MKNSNPTQCDRVLSILKDGKWHSVREFMTNFIPRYSARIHELKKRGLWIEKRKTEEDKLEQWRLLNPIL